MKTIFTIIAMTSVLALAGCSTHHAHSSGGDSSFKAYMKANEAANTSNMMKITPIPLSPNKK
jgi:D-serine deaminase-like pyridoxal phosphate-dependent protein